MQGKGSLTETRLRSLLEEAQSERATGTLTLRNDGRLCTLYFLFGHLFHALNEGVTGDEAVVSALGWESGDFDFDPKAKLPADETVKATIPELVDTASSANSTAPAAPAAEVYEAPPEPVHAEPEPRPEPRPEHRAEHRPEPPPPAAEHRHHVEPEREPAARRGVKHRPQPRHGREPIPVPAGRVTYDSLKTSFVDFPRLITTLEKEAYTGYVRLLTEDATGLIFFREGAALECVYDVGENQAMMLGKPALQAFNEDVTHGHGVLDVVELSPELIDGLYDLTVAKPKYTDLYASWVNMPALLKFLEERQFSGSVMVRASAGTGVIILTDGDLAGAYTSESRDIAAEPEGVLALCADPEAMIEVKAAAEGTHTPLRVDEVIGGNHRPAQRPARAPEPEPVFAPAATPRPSVPPVENVAPPPPPLPPSATQHLHPVHTAPPMPAAPAHAAARGANGVDWEHVISTLQGMAEEALGNRSRKVKDILGGAEHSRAGIEGAINQIPTISLLFVDSSRLEALAQEMRTRLESLI